MAEAWTFCAPTTLRGHPDHTPARSEETPMIRTLVNTMGCTVVVLGVMPTLAGAAVMTCTQDQETVLSSPAAGQAIRKDCIMAQGGDGQEVPVMVPNTKRGDRVDCKIIEGKMACK